MTLGHEQGDATLMSTGHIFHSVIAIQISEAILPFKWWGFFFAFILTIFCFITYSHPYFQLLLKIPPKLKEFPVCCLKELSCFSVQEFLFRRNPKELLSLTKQQSSTSALVHLAYRASRQKKGGSQRKPGISKCLDETRISLVTFCFELNFLCAPRLFKNLFSLKGLIFNSE